MLCGADGARPGAAKINVVPSLQRSYDAADRAPPGPGLAGGVGRRGGIGLADLLLAFKILLDGFADEGVGRAAARGGEMVHAFGVIGIEFEVGCHWLFFLNSS